MLIISLPILIIPKKIKVVVMVLSENPLAKLSNIKNPLKKKKLSIVSKENNEENILKL